MLLDRAVLVNLFSRSNSQKQARKSGGHVVGEFNRTDPTGGLREDIIRMKPHLSARPNNGVRDKSETAISCRGRGSTNCVSVAVVGIRYLHDDGLQDQPSISADKLYICCW